MYGLVRAMPHPDPGSPPLRGPGAFIWWQVKRQRGVLAGAVGLGMIAALCQAALPYLLGRAVDDGLGEGIGQDLLWWCALLLCVGLVSVVANAGSRWPTGCAQR